ncbi:NUDIX hydrolase [Halosimplex sp. TS25]|uniref:NUDIX hydrolase n=1 Tax=Halosimplex rarum TaxID=3396619 RepID=UPI0039ECF1F7
MERTDPRERYDDLVVNSERHAVDAERFEEIGESEVFRSGWGVGGVAFDADGRLLAIRNEAYPTEWTLPGGAVEDGEGLSSAVVREVAEETGVGIEPVRPLGVDESLVTDGERSAEMRFVHFLARATDPEVDRARDLGDPDEEITDACWLDELPEDVFNPEYTREVYEFARDLDSGR